MTCQNRKWAYISHSNFTCFANPFSCCRIACKTINLHACCFHRCIELYTVLNYNYIVIFVMKLRKRHSLCIESTLFTATVLEGLFREYHSSSAALGQQCPEVTKQPLVCDWPATSEALCDVNRRFALAKSFTVICHDIIII